MTEECSICFEDMDEATKINKCGHTFHHDCIKEWTEINQSCPICREDTAPQFVQKVNLSDNYTNIIGVTAWRRISVINYFTIEISLIDKYLYNILNIKNRKKNKYNDIKYPKKPLSNRKHKIVRHRYGNLGRAVF